MSRISWQEYFIEVLNAAALRASCDRGKSGAVLIRDNRLLSMGYVGAPAGIPSCDEVGHELITRYEELDNLHKNRLPLQEKDFSHHCVRTMHSEANAIINCARNGISTVGATMYCTMTPCVNCAMMIIQAGIIKVIAKNRYQKDQKTKDLFKQAKIELIVLDNNLLY
jgi:dCMP deaminase